MYACGIYFTLKILKQVVGIVAREDDMRSGRIFFFLASFLLVAHILFYFAYLLLVGLNLVNFFKKSKNPNKRKAKNIEKNKTNNNFPFSLI